MAKAARHPLACILLLYMTCILLLMYSPWCRYIRNGEGGAPPKPGSGGILVRPRSKHVRNTYTPPKPGSGGILAVGPGSKHVRNTYTPPKLGSGGISIRTTLETR